MAWEIVIGLETHTQLSTLSKIFSGASTAFGAAPNTQASPVDLALPGTLPVLNRAAVERAIRFGLAVGASVAPLSIFARKNYFYPDLPKGYQISQMDDPVVTGGSVSFLLEEHGQWISKTVRLTRAHLEEDAGKSLHEDYAGMTGIDLNRAGTPLLEIVSEPEMRSSAEAVAYAKTLHTLVMWLGVCDGNMQEGSFRCDANVSVRPVGQEKLGTRCEIKNLNSFRFLQDAIDYEARRHIELIEDGGRVIQETRLWDPDRQETRSMRSKEDAHDYRYFPDPDLPPLAISSAWIERVKADMPELPAALRTRLITQFELTEYDASVLTSSLAIAQYFEAVVQHVGPGNAKLAANWVMGEVQAQCNRDDIALSAAPVAATQLARLLLRIADETISGKIAKDLFVSLWTSPQAGDDAVDRLIDDQGLRQISDRDALLGVIDQIIAANPKQVGDYRSGKDKLFGFFVGQAMKATGGKANPQQLNAILIERLSA
jgi:aspartyl-tRNA(Asn)/glutamyl-tRNA(Gln) amidotransferase subunit B